MKMKRIWVHKATSFRDAEEFDRHYYRAMSAKERVETVQYLRELYLRLPSRHRKHAPNGKGLRRVLTIVQ